MTYAPPGYLLFARDKTLVAQPFDAKALKITGEPTESAYAAAFAAETGSTKKAA